MAWHGMASHRIASHRIASRRIASHRIASHRIADMDKIGCPPYPRPVPPVRGMDAREMLVLAWKNQYAREKDAVGGLMMLRFGHDHMTKRLGEGPLPMPANNGKKRKLKELIFGRLR
jgi:hypothetical protein